MATTHPPDHLVEKLNELRSNLLGFMSNTYKSKITDIFITPNQWYFAREVFKLKKEGVGFPFINGDKFTIVAVFENNNIEEISTVIKEDEIEHLKGLTSDLPRMQDEKKQWFQDDK